MFSCEWCTVDKCLELDETTTDGGVDKVATTTLTKTYFEDLGRIAESNRPLRGKRTPCEGQDSYLTSF